MTGIAPGVEGLTVEVLDADDRLLLVNESGRTIAVLGYDGEPYLRVTPEGVFRNARSPATWLNEDRYADVDLPPVVDSSAAPRWELVADEPHVEWHDHRIHWMSPTAPPQVADDPGAAHRILDWEVPLEAEGAGAELPARPPAPDFELRDSDGTAVRLSDQRGKLVFVTFLYTRCPDICQFVADGLNRALVELGPDRESVRVPAVSVDDVVAFAAGPGSGLVDHSAQTLLVDADGRRRVAYAAGASTADYVNDVRALLDR